jgi:hypothetical protein
MITRPRTRTSGCLPARLVGRVMKQCEFQPVLIVGDHADPSCLDDE